MRCPYCGEDNPDDAIVCEHCGKALKRSKREYIEKMREEEAKDDEAFFESDMYNDDDQYNDNEDDSFDDEGVDITKQEAEEVDEEAAEGFHFDENDESKPKHGFNFNEGEDDDSYEDIEEPEESGAQVIWSRFKNYVLGGREAKNQTERREEELTQDDEATRIYTPKDEEATRIYNPHEDKAYEETVPDFENVAYKKKSLSIPYKGIVIIVAVVLVVGLIFYTKNRSAQTTTTKTRTTSVSANPTIASVKASSTLVQSGYDYSPELMFDDNAATAWNVRKPLNGIGATATFTLEKKSKVKSCSIMNGYDKSETIYYKNNRIRSCTFIFADGSETFTLKDLYNKAQKITFKKTHQTRTVKIRINSIYWGRVFRDTCISEISFS